MNYNLNRLKQLRGDELQQTVADATGINRSTLSQYEMGKIPSAQHAIALAEYFHVSLDYIFGLSSERSPKSGALQSSFVTLQNLAGDEAPSASDVAALVDAAILYLCSGKPCGTQPVIAWRDFMRQLTKCFTACVNKNGPQLLDSANAAAVAAIEVTKMPAMMLAKKEDKVQ